MKKEEINKSAEYIEKSIKVSFDDEFQRTNGGAIKHKNENGEYYSLSEYAQILGFALLEDYRLIASGEKKREETNIDLRMSVLNSIAKIV